MYVPALPGTWAFLTSYVSVYKEESERLVIAYLYKISGVLQMIATRLIYSNDLRNTVNN